MLLLIFLHERVFSWTLYSLNGLLHADCQRRDFRKNGDTREAPCLVSYLV